MASAHAMLQDARLPTSRDFKEYDIKDPHDVFQPTSDGEDVWIRSGVDNPAQELYQTIADPDMKLIPTTHKATATGTTTPSHSIHHFYAIYQDPVCSEDWCTSDPPQGLPRPKGSTDCWAGSATEA